MGRFHRHESGVHHEHDLDDDPGHHHDHALGDHSGYATAVERVDVLERIFDENDRLAAVNRRDLDQHAIVSVNVMSSPGAGKTALLRETLVRLGSRHRIGVIEGDIETALDAERLSGLGAAVELVNTGNGFGGECHLDAPMIRPALLRLPLDELDLIIVENVGNLVCPAEFDVGAHCRAMVFSVTEGEDKPLKYPVMFRAADVIVINKIDLLPHLDFDLALFERHLAAVHPSVTKIFTSIRTGEGVDDWCAWLTAQLTAVPAS